MSIPKQQVTFSKSCQQSVREKVQCWMESVTGEDWDWRPFNQPQKRLWDKDVRISWKCHCGEQLYEDVWEKQAKICEKLLALRRDPSSRDHLCAGRGKKVRQKGIHDSLAHEAKSTKVLKLIDSKKSMKISGTMVIATLFTVTVLSTCIPLFLSNSSCWTAMAVPSHCNEVSMRWAHYQLFTAVSWGTFSSLYAALLSKPTFQLLGALLGSFTAPLAATAMGAAATALFGESSSTLRAYAFVGLMTLMALGIVLASELVVGRDQRYFNLEVMGREQNYSKTRKKHITTMTTEERAQSKESSLPEIVSNNSNETRELTSSTPSGLNALSHPAKPAQTADAAQQDSCHVQVGVVQTLRVILGVNGTRRTLDIDQLDMTRKRHDGTSLNDGEYFRDVVDAYERMRGFWRLWFSVWQFRYCRFRKFEKIRKSRVISRGDSLPSDADYEYTPCPPEAELPPITKHEFKSSLFPCRQRCFFSLFHDCIEPLTEDFAIQRTPKKKTLWSLDCPGGGRYAWGLEAAYEISFIYVVVYHSLIVAGTFGFWGWWQVTHPQDVQGAAVPLTIVVALLSLFWTSSGILAVLSDSTA